MTTLFPERIVDLAEQEGFDPVRILERASESKKMELLFDEQLLNSIVSLKNEELRAELCKELTRGEAVIALYKRKLLSRVRNEEVQQWYPSDYHSELLTKDPGVWHKVLADLRYQAELLQYFKPSYIFDNLNELVGIGYESRTYGMQKMQISNYYNSSILYLYPLAYPESTTQDYADFYTNYVARNNSSRNYHDLFTLYKKDDLHREVWLQRFMDLLLHTEVGNNLAVSQLEKLSSYSVLWIFLKGLYTYYPEDSAFFFSLIKDVYYGYGNREVNDELMYKLGTEELMLTPEQIAEVCKFVLETFNITSIDWSRLAVQNPKVLCLLLRLAQDPETRLLVENQNIAEEIMETRACEENV